MNQCLMREPVAIDALYCFSLPIHGGLTKNYHSPHLLGSLPLSIVNMRPQYRMIGLPASPPVDDPHGITTRTFLAMYARASSSETVNLLTFW